MSPNPKKIPGSNPKLPDWVCNQDNGACGSTVQKTNAQGVMKTYENVTGAWNPTPKQPITNQPAQTPMVANPTGDGFVPNAFDQKETKRGQQMNRSNLAAAVLHGKDLDWKQLVALEAWVISGQTPEQLGTQEINIDDIPFK